VAWVRDGDAPDEVKVSFVVNKADHPELVEWLWGLPFRKQSSVIRDVLSNAAKMVSSEIVPARPAVTGKPAQKEVRSVHLNETPPGSTTMTEATAAIIRTMNRDF